MKKQLILILMLTILKSTSVLAAGNNDNMIQSNGVILSKYADSHIEIVATALANEQKEQERKALFDQAFCNLRHPSNLFELHFKAKSKKQIAQHLEILWKTRVAQMTRNLEDGCKPRSKNVAPGVIFSKYADAHIQIVATALAIEQIDNNRKAIFDLAFCNINHSSDLFETYIKVQPKDHIVQYLEVLWKTRVAQMTRNLEDGCLK